MWIGDLGFELRLVKKDLNWTPQFELHFGRIRCWVENTESGFNQKLDLAINNVKPKDCYFVLDYNQSARSRTTAIYLDNIVGLCYRWVLVLECWKIFPGLLTYVLTWGCQRFAIWGDLFSRLGGWGKCVNYLVFHSRQAGQTVSSVCSSSSNQSESCIYLCTSIRIVKSPSLFSLDK